MTLLLASKLGIGLNSCRQEPAFAGTHSLDPESGAEKREKFQYFHSQGGTWKLVLKSQDGSDRLSYDVDSMILLGLSMGKVSEEAEGKSEAQE